MNKGFCQHCGASLAGKRKSALYCSDSCRVQGHFARHGTKPATAKTGQALGTVETKTVYVRNEEYLKLEAALNQAAWERSILEGQRKRLMDEMYQVADPNKTTRIGAVLGALLGLSAAAMSDSKSGRYVSYTATGAVTGGLLGYLYKEAMGEQSLSEEKRALIRFKAEQIGAIDRLILSADVAIHGIRNQMLRLPRRQVLQAGRKAEVNAGGFAPLHPPGFSPKNERQGKAKQALNSVDLANRNFRTWKFDGALANLLGQPEQNAHVIIHGQPGSGKSTLACRIAGELSSRYGRVLYVAAEEGLKQTMQGKIGPVANPYLDVIDWKNWQEIKQAFQNGLPYPFIIIDSIQVMQITPEQLESLRSASMVIAISQSTKGGHMRGSLEYAHNADVVIRVENGKAVSEKNRYGPSGLELQFMEPVAARR